MMGTRLRLAHICALGLLLTACGTSHGVPDSGPREGDAGRGVDAGPRGDAGSAVEDAGSAGEDAGHPPADAGGPFDAGPAASCDAEDARAEVCPDALCDGPGSWHWDGERCFYIDCGACRGSDCGGPTTQAACEAAHAACEPQLCRDTGGTWRWWDEVCGHYECGFPPPEDCLVGGPACDCGPGMRFDPSEGCVAAECPAIDPLPPETLCESTGGTWTADICCPTTCGEYCTAECLAPACVCGPREVFDSVRGCEVGQPCVERELGQSCDERTRCADGLICCDSCGGAGCAGAPTCRAPVCDSNPDIDTCGNNLLAP
jgi:hypothetical protein